MPIPKKLTICVILLFTACAFMLAPRLGKPVSPQGLKDGLYEGVYSWGPNKAKVEVTIDSNKIAAIKIIQHRNMKGKKAEGPIIDRIIKNQSTQVDAVSGATNSSQVIMNAVQDAITKAY